MKHRNLIPAEDRYLHQKSPLHHLIFYIKARNCRYGRQGAESNFPQFFDDDPIAVGRDDTAE